MTRTDIRSKHRTHVERNHDGEHYAWCSHPGCTWGSDHFETSGQAYDAGKNHEEEPEEQSND